MAEPKVSGGGVMRQKMFRLAGGAAIVIALMASATAAYAYGPGGAASLTGSTSTCVASTGCTLTLTGTGFQPGETVALVLDGTPVSLGTTTADPSGDFTQGVSIPANSTAGAHTIVATGETSGAVASFAITLTSSTTGVSSPTTPSAPSSSLPLTGADISAMVGAAAVAIALGAMLVLASRRRRSARSSVS
ncbi:MAG: LPXTG cell wall anchor domain-containing protein [Acidimicrobiales bacterium]